MRVKFAALMTALFSVSFTATALAAPAATLVTSPMTPPAATPIKTPMAAPVTTPVTTKIRSQAAPTADSSPSTVEDWKGKPDEAGFSFGVMGGLGIIDATGGFSLVGTASRKITDQGFVPDINNSVSIELELGPLFASGGNALFYSTHLRWDFQKDSTWTFYALGGFGGFSSNEELGSHSEFFPRFGAGALWRIDGVLLRGELSHELVGFGVNFPL